MKHSIGNILILVLVLIPNLEGRAQADVENKPESIENSPSPSGVGATKAVVAADLTLGFKLSEPAIKSLEVKLAPLVISGGMVTVPAKAMLFYQAETGVFRIRDGWFKLIGVKILKKNLNDFTIKNSELVSGDQIAVSGAPLLRIVDLNLWAGEGSCE